MAKKKTKFQQWLAYMKKTAPGEIPALDTGVDTSMAGKVLTIGADGKPYWTDVAGTLPDIKDTDRNKVLVVDSNGVPTWGTVAGEDIPLGENESIGIFKE